MQKVTFLKILKEMGNDENLPKMIILDIIMGVIPFFDFDFLKIFENGRTKSVLQV